MNSTSSIIDRLSSSPVIYDGDLTPFFLERGMTNSQPPEWCTLHAPHDVTEIHRTYQEAGATILRTNTLHANPLRLLPTALASECQACNREAVALARSVTAPSTNLAGRVGPTGSMLPPIGAASPYEVRAAYETQIGHLVEAGVDMLHVDQMTDLREATMALRVGLGMTDQPIVVTLVLMRGRRGFVTPAGDAAGDALRSLLDAGAIAVGASSSLDSAAMVPLAGAMRAHLAVPLVLLPTAGAPILTLTGQSYPDTPETFGRHARQMFNHGVSAVGGACGTTPGHIAAIAASPTATSPPPAPEDP